jgi:hypothetical protein
MCPGDMGSGVPPRQSDTRGTKEIGLAMTCKHTDCNRRVHSRGWCTTHYRRWRAGQDMDAPVRGYVRYDEVENGNVRPVTTPIRRARKDPFAEELELLRELGLR